MVLYGGAGDGRWFFAILNLNILNPNQCRGVLRSDKDVIRAGEIASAVCEGLQELRTKN